ncbi:hypothetical protein CDAR_107341 [Caerostris darwini]|uniref:Uncharacterized protein n=1 Tax=Caerostris darwini TaxID=1538125 RepID=A0AAV4NEQ1_9ARAC|nr:hypothetical protein CDAR_107341 [Caerostris darwini]
MKVEFGMKNMYRVLSVVFVRRHGLPHGYKQRLTDRRTCNWHQRNYDFLTDLAWCEATWLRKRWTVVPGKLSDDENDVDDLLENSAHEHDEHFQKTEERSLELGSPWRLVSRTEERTLGQPYLARNESCSKNFYLDIGWGIFYWKALISEKATRKILDHGTPRHHLFPPGDGCRRQVRANTPGNRRLDVHLRRNDSLLADSPEIRTGCDIK